jgi:hypothetical protein
MPHRIDNGLQANNKKALEIEGLGKKARPGDGAGSVY